jgi:antitoxin (DNA-binding transcriptional repressor) of toxin-antitoxin stability system
MRAVGIKVLKNKLSEYVRLAASGETVLVTDRERVVAELVPPQLHRGPSAVDALLSDMVAKGLVTPPTLPGRGLPPRKPIMSFEQLMADLQQDRDDR